MRLSADPRDRDRQILEAQERIQHLDLLLRERAAAVRAEVAEAVKIVPEAIGEEYARLPSELALANARYAAVYERYVKADADVKYTKAVVRISTRNRMKSADPKCTEAAIEAEVETDDRYRGAVAVYLDADIARVEALGVLESLRSKRDMLISIGAHIRSELRSLYGLPTNTPTP